MTLLDLFLVHNLQTPVARENDLDFSLYCTESHGSKMCTQQVGFLTKVIIILHGVKGTRAEM